MYIKEISKSKLLLESEVIYSRLSPNHNQYAIFERDYLNRLSGFNGEKSLEYYFSFLPEKDFLIFHGPRLKGAIHHFQMDFLLLTHQYFLIVEVKNLSGKITFNEFNQMIQEKDGELKRYDDPVLQVEHQAFQFKQWLADRKVPQIPVESIVVFTNPNAILKVESQNSLYLKNVILSTKLLKYVEGLKRKYNRKVLDSRQLKRISNLILKNHTDLEQNLYEKYHINKMELLTGVHCPKCNRLPMRWIKGKWFCPQCQNISKDAHLNGIRDFNVIHGGVATNKQLREFLHIPSENIMYKLLMKMNLRKTGNTKDRLYFLSEIR